MSGDTVVVEDKKKNKKETKRTTAHIPFVEERSALLPMSGKYGGRIEELEDIIIAVNPEYTKDDFER